MENTILSKNQKNVLQALAQERSIVKHFYLTGGTALSEFYLQHRLSEDLDFFCEQEFDPEAIQVIFKKIQKHIGLRKIDFEQNFNRNLFFLHIGRDLVKAEFTFFPFPPIEKPIIRNGIRIDHLLDIAVNKVFTIYQRPRSRDFIDLYFILQKEKWAFDYLIKKTKIKFDWHIDPLQMGSQLIKVKELKDFPRMIKKIETSLWQDFFIDLAKNLRSQIFQ